MINYFRVADAQQVIADVSAAGSITIVGFAWLANINEVLRFVALAVAIVSGTYAAIYHYRKNKELDEK